MASLNFPPREFRFKNKENKTAIFDVVRKKFIQLTPEEWVRQHCVHFLIEDKNFPPSLINVEKKIELNGLDKRYDIVVFKPDGEILIIVECKAPQIKITQDVFDQIARYNLALRADYLMLTNGLEHYYCQMDYSAQKYRFLRDLPDYKSL